MTISDERIEREGEGEVKQRKNNMKIYAIGIPWDSRMVDGVEVFTGKETAEAQALHYGTEGFNNGYVSEPEVYEFEVETPGYDALLAAARAALKASHDPIVERILAEAIAAVEVKPCQK